MKLVKVTYYTKDSVKSDSYKTYAYFDIDDLVRVRIFNRKLSLNINLNFAISSYEKFLGRHFIPGSIISVEHIS